MAEVADVFSIVYGEGETAVDIGAMVDAVLTIDRDIGSKWNNTLGQGTGRYGSSYISSTLESKPITIQFAKELRQNEMSLWKEEFASAVDSINGIQKLTFNDQPNRYYNAVVDDAISFSYDVGSGMGVGSITFLVPDGLAHSTVNKLINSDTTDTENVGSIGLDDDGNILVTMINKGNTETYPTITVVNKVENDYLGFANSESVFELGNKTDPNGSNPVTKNKTSLNIAQSDSSKTTGWGQFIVSTLDKDPLVNNLATNGTLDYGTPHSLFKAGFKMATPGTNPSNKGWYGGSRYFALLEADQTISFKLEWVSKFWEKAFGQTGIQVVTVTDKNDVPIMGYSIHKSDISGDTTIADVRYNKSYPTNGGDSNMSTPKSWTFGANNNEKAAKRPNVAFNSSKGQVKMTKTGATLTWSYNTETYTLAVPILASAKAAKIYVSFGRPKTVNSKVGVVPVNLINSMTYTAIDATDYTDAPNLYAVGSKNTINMGSGNAYYSVDSGLESIGSIQNEDIVPYSDGFALPKGKSTLMVQKSEWADWTGDNAPTISVEFQEHFIG